MIHLKYFESNENAIDVRHIISAITDNDHADVKYKETRRYLGEDSAVKPILVDKYFDIKQVNIRYSEFNADDMLELGTAIKRLEILNDITYELKTSQGTIYSCSISVENNLIEQKPIDFDFSEIARFFKYVGMINEKGIGHFYSDPSAWHHQHGITLNKELVEFLQTKCEQLPAGTLIASGMDHGEVGTVYKHILKSKDGKHELEVLIDYDSPDSTTFLAINNNAIDTAQMFKIFSKLCETKMRR